MERRNVCQVQGLTRKVAAAAVVAATIVLVGCQPIGRPTLPVSASAVVDLGAETAAAQLSNGRVAVLVAVPGQSAPRTITSSAAAPGGTVNMLTYGGTEAGRWNTFVYGNAPADVVRVELTLSGGVGGQVVDGAWLIVLPDPDMTPDVLHWRFLGQDGSALREGEGVLSSN
jgi:hypothetical protein